MCAGARAFFACGRTRLADTIEDVVSSVTALRDGNALVFRENETLEAAGAIGGGGACDAGEWTSLAFSESVGVLVGRAFVGASTVEGEKERWGTRGAGRV